MQKLNDRKKNSLHRYQLFCIKIKRQILEMRKKKKARTKVIKNSGTEINAYSHIQTTTNHRPPFQYTFKIYGNNIEILSFESYLPAC